METVKRRRSQPMALPEGSAPARAVLAPLSALAAHSGLLVRSAVAPPPPLPRPPVLRPCSCPLLPPGPLHRHLFAHPPHSLAFALPRLSLHTPPNAGNPSLAVHQFLLTMAPPGRGRLLSPLVRVSVLQCGSARLCFPVGCVD